MSASRNRMRQDLRAFNIRSLLAKGSETHPCTSGTPASPVQGHFISERMSGSLSNVAASIPRP